MGGGRGGGCLEPGGHEHVRKVFDSFVDDSFDDLRRGGDEADGVVDGSFGEVPDGARHLASAIDGRVVDVLQEVGFRAHGLPRHLEAGADGVGGETPRRADAVGEEGIRRPRRVLEASDCLAGGVPEGAAEAAQALRSVLESLAEDVARSLAEGLRGGQGVGGHVGQDASGAAGGFQEAEAARRRHLGEVQDLRAGAYPGHAHHRHSHDHSSQRQHLRKRKGDTHQ